MGPEAPAISEKHKVGMAPVGFFMYVNTSRKRPRRIFRVCVCEYHLVFTYTKNPTGPFLLRVFHLSRGLLVPINRDKLGITVCDKMLTLLKFL